MSENSASAPLRILVIRLSAMGDVAMTVPVVGALRRVAPDARIGNYHNKGANISFLDGHVANLPRVELESTNSKINYWNINH